jgi:UDP-2,3-diacylglucosamine hydrolase
VIHGDGVQAGRSDYHKRHPVLRSSAFRWIAQRLFHLDRIYDAVAKYSETTELVERQRRGDTGPKPAAPLIEAWAREALAVNQDVDLVLAGHSHLPALVEVAPGRYYMNTGDWVSHMTYGVIPATGAPELRAWPDQTVFARGVVGLDAKVPAPRL